jgi:enamine deaminase RidA (YjgF/YER057c/UK114 family)
MPMAVELVRADRLSAAVPYAYAAIAPPGGLIFTAGACPLDQDRRVVAPGDVEAQARQVMDNLTEALAAAGAGLTDVLKTTVYVASPDRADLVAAWEVVRTAFGDHDAPSTLLGVAVLGYPGQLVEVEAVALAVHPDHRLPADDHGDGHLPGPGTHPQDRPRQGRA